MNKLDKIYNIFQRQTTSLSFIPQIDGLRFVAIMMVILFHINIFVVNKIPFIFTKPAVDYWWFLYFLDTDRKGVFLFFVISGFILAMPFAKAELQGGSPVKLKNYFLRRLTRLEPPYFLVMTACFLAVLFLKGNGFISMFPKTFSGLFPTFASSLAYMHNIIYPNNLSINPVAWSLEVEIQFYILVPLLVLVFKLSKQVRTTLLVVAISAVVLLQHFYKPGFYSIYNYLQYFLLGFLLVDIYLSGWKAKLGTWLSLPIGLLCLLFFMYVDFSAQFYLEYIFLVTILGFYLLALTNDIWKRIFSIRWLTIIGGMCYSIYLLHYLIIAVVGNKTIAFNISYLYPISYIWHFAILFPIIMLCSAIFYLLIEKPCMDKNWPKKFWSWGKNVFSGNKYAIQAGNK